MKILSSYISTEFTVKNSRFFCELFPCESQNEARSIIKSQKNKYNDATHVVHGFMLGLNAEILGMSDDGEPSGTAGRPVLDVIKGRGCTNILLTVTRWFGGTLLGTGGLVKAYGDGAKLVLDKAEAQGAITEFIETKDFSFCATYSLYPNIKRVLEKFTIKDISEEFGTDITVKGKICADEYENFCACIKNTSNGAVEVL